MKTRAFRHLNSLTRPTSRSRLLEHVANTSDVDPSRRNTLAKADLRLWRRINLIVDDWTKRRPVEAHYSTELIRSKAAREQWVPPDLLPTPF